MHNTQVSAISHPTTVLSIDDNRKYHRVIRLAVDDRNATCQFYDDAKKALQFLKEEYTPHTMINRWVQGNEDQAVDKPSIEVDIHAIRQEIYNAHRFEEIAVVVLDYAMPGMNGGEVAQQLSELPFKIILLTGEADASIAIELFNQGIIHLYIRKDDPHFDTLLNTAICDLQHKYFQDISTIVMHGLSQSESPRIWFKDPAFKSLFDQICKKHETREYYLLDEYGSFLLLDARGKPSWFAVTNEEMMQTYLLFAEGDHASDSITNGLKSKKIMPFFFTEDDFNVRPAEWEKYLYPAQVLQGHETYYYTYISNQNAYAIDGKILSYAAFLDAQK